MAQQVYMPQKKKDDGLGKALTLGGAVVGGVAGGGPAGAMAGANAGQMAGGLVASNQGAPPQAVATTENPMARRVQSNDTLMQLRDAQSAVAQLPPEQQSQYANPINQAYAMEAKRRGMA